MGTVVARVTVGLVKPTTENIVKAMEFEAETEGQIPRFDVFIDDEGKWSLMAFDVWMGMSYLEASGYHPLGRSGKLASQLAEETGGEVEWLVDTEIPEDAEA